KNKEVKANMTIASSPSLMITLAKSVAVFKKDFPNIDIKIIEQTTSEVIQNIQKNKVSLGFIALNDDLLKREKKFDYGTLLNTERYVCVGKDSILSLQKTIKPKDISKEAFVSYN